MAQLYVNSAGGAPAAPFDTWAKAAAALADVDGVVSTAGDEIFVHPSHAETAANATFSGGTQDSPIRIICGTPAGTTGISALANTAQVSLAANASNVSYSGNAYFYGIVFRFTGSTGAATYTFNGNSAEMQTYENCEFTCAGTGGGTFIFGASENATQLINCRFRLGGTGQNIRFSSRCLVNGLTAIAGGATPTSLLFSISNTTANAAGSVELNGLDLSALGSSLIITGATTKTSVARFRNLKLPAGWAGTLTSGTVLTGSKIEMLNYGVGDTNYKFWIEDRQGRAKDETTIKRTTNPASDGTTSYSMRLQTLAANVNPMTAVYRSPPIIKRHAAAPGTTRKVAVQIAHDGASALTDKEVWLELEYLGTAGFPLATFASDQGAYLSSAAGQPASGIAWDGASGTGPNGSTTWHRLQLETPNITVEEEGYLIATVCMGVPNKVIFVDPQLNITVT